MTLPHQQLNVRVPAAVRLRAEELRQEVAALGHPRATQGDLVAALICAATAAKAAAALQRYYATPLDED